MFPLPAVKISRKLGKNLFSPASAGSHFTNDFASRMNYQATGILLLAFMAYTVKQDRPIRCAVPANFPNSWATYAESVCYMEGTYFVPFNVSALNADRAKRRLYRTHYYQWTWAFYIFVACSCAFPHLLWKLACTLSGSKLTRLVAELASLKLVDPARRRDCVEDAARLLSHSLNLRLASQRQLGCCRCLLGLCLCGCWRRAGKFHSVTFAIVKLLYLCVSCLTLPAINRFLNCDTKLLGFHLIAQSIWSDSSWTSSGQFPRVAMCDFGLFDIGQMRHYTVQCGLHMNMINEKIFATLWCWLVILCIINAISLLQWLCRVCSRGSRRQFVLKLLRVHGNSAYNRCSVNDFVDNYVGCDGVFCLRMLADCCGDLLTCDIARCLWKAYRAERELQIVKQDEWTGSLV